MSQMGMPAEQRARQVIDAKLEAAGWAVQDRRDTNLSAKQGVAIREVYVATDAGRVDYLLYVDAKIVGVIEAKPAGTNLAEVEFQALRYARSLTEAQRRLAVFAPNEVLPFVFMATSTEIYFANYFDPRPRSRKIFNFQKPETLAEWIRDAQAKPDTRTWRGKVQNLPDLDLYDAAPETRLRPASKRAIQAIENCLQNDHFSRSLVQMATGAGKTRMAVTESYRLINFGGFKRVLFLVDRNNLADQTLSEFANYTTPFDGRKFTELYVVEKLGKAGLPESASVVISTIQRVWAGLKGDQIPDADLDDPQLDNFNPDTVVEAQYNLKLPPEAFDLIIVDECHRSIYGLWRNVIEYFDAHIIGLTATPTKQTFGFFQQNLVSEYTYPESVADGVNVDFDVYRIKTAVTEGGGLLPAGSVVPAIDTRTNAQKIEQLDQDIEYKPSDLDRAVVSNDQIRLVLDTFKAKIPDIFPGRTKVPKTLIFAKSDSHADDIVRIGRQVFGQGNDFMAKITYTADSPKDLLQKLRNDASMRIAVTVDMIATGTDVKPLECVFFMRDIKSGTYFEQMKGRGARSIDDAEFQRVTEDATHKERFVIVDAVGVTEHPFNDVTVLDRVKTVPIERLLEKAANLELTQDEALTLASRLSRISRKLTPEQRQELQEVSSISIEEIAGQLIQAGSEDRILQHIKETGKEREEAIIDLVIKLAEPLANNPVLRQKLVVMNQSFYRLIDEQTQDVLLDAHGVVDTEKAKHVVESWAKYLEENKNEIEAIQLLTSQRGSAKVTFRALESLIEAIRLPHPEWTPEVIWKAYKALNMTNKSMLNATTDLVSLVRYSLGIMPELVNFKDTVEDKYQNWLAVQKQAGSTFTEQQMWWLNNIKNTICSSVTFEIDDLEKAPFPENGGSIAFAQQFPTNAREILTDLNQALSA
jgi:type I restriction enzyme R subunit